MSIQLEDIFGVSIVLVVVMTASLSPAGRDLWTRLGAFAVTCLLAVSLFAVALRLAWFLVGGKATVRSFFVTYAYFFGVILVVLMFFMLLSDGIFKVFEPELYKQTIEARLTRKQVPDLSKNFVVLVSFFILIAGIFFVSLWGFAAWEAYRELNGLGKGRSFIALMISGVFGWPIAAIVYFVARAMG